MIVDTSTLLAILNREPDANRYVTAVLAAAPCRMSVANVLEAAIVVESRGGAETGHELDAFLGHAGIEPTPATAEHLAAARAAWRRLGTGRHPAALNFGDCFAYALAHVTGEALIYKDGDFAQTDILSALSSSRGSSGA